MKSVLISFLMFAVMFIILQYNVLDLFVSNAFHYIVLVCCAGVIIWAVIVVGLPKFPTNTDDKTTKTETKENENK